MIDIVREIDAVQREVGSGRLAAGEARTVRLRRTYDAPIDDVWDALTNPERIGRWFLPISGDYRVGGRYQFEGNAGGEIVACERPNRLRVTWVFGEMADAASVRARGAAHARAATTATTFELEHTAIVPDEMLGAVRAGRRRRGLGPGRARAGAPPARRLGRATRRRGSCRTRGATFATRSSEAWGAASAAAGADAETVARNVANTNGFYAPEPDAPS